MVQKSFDELVVAHLQMMLPNDYVGEQGSFMNAPSIVVHSHYWHTFEVMQDGMSDSEIIMAVHKDRTSWEDNAGPIIINTETLIYEVGMNPMAVAATMFAMFMKVGGRPTMTYQVEVNATIYIDVQASSFDHARFMAERILDSKLPDGVAVAYKGSFVPSNHRSE